MRRDLPHGVASLHALEKEWPSLGGASSCRYTRPSSIWVRLHSAKQPKQFTVTLLAGPGTCGMLFCQGDSAIYWCNDVSLNLQLLSDLVLCMGCCRITPYRIQLPQR